MSLFHVSRRDLVLSAAGAYAAFGLTKSIVFIGAAQAQRLPDQGFLKYKIGDLEVISLSDGISEAVHREGWSSNQGRTPRRRVIGCLRTCPLHGHGRQDPWASSPDRLRHWRLPDLWSQGWALGEEHGSGRP